MYLPDIVRTTHDALKQCSLVKGIETAHSVNEFVSILNKCIPIIADSANYNSSYQLVKGMYNADKWRFLLFITGSKQLQPLVLWTTAEEILNCFTLNEKLILEWDEQKCQYKGRLVNPSVSDKVVKASVAEQPKLFIPEDEDEEMERVYEYMQSRLAGLQK